ncbi:mavicyanin-like [Diospyros lotus]|uniref:mavicyanin-like n=1 Tax=Diospyros lotus TaxID=55363 RepID=UPI0022555BB2|nr:mavicyanin-like [Diospyros lotus]
MELGVKSRVIGLLVAIFAGLQVSSASVYKVGDSAGWTTIGNVDYKQWAATKTFQLGDVIIFQYNPQFHNVMRVNHTGYRSCNASNPIATHTSGNDSITINTHGHHFFMCGVPGHCQAGQKVDINVLHTPVAPPPSVTPISPSPPGATTPAPSPSSTDPSRSLPGLLTALALSMSVSVAFA